MAAEAPAIMNNAEATDAAVAVDVVMLKSASVPVPLAVLAPDPPVVAESPPVLSPVLSPVLPLVLPPLLALDVESDPPLTGAVVDPPLPVVVVEVLPDTGVVVLTGVVVVDVVEVVVGEPPVCGSVVGAAQY